MSSGWEHPYPIHRGGDDIKPPEEGFPLTPRSEEQHEDTGTTFWTNAPKLEVLQNWVYSPASYSSSEDGYLEDTEHIDFAALKDHLNVFRPGNDVDVSDHKKGKYVFYSMQTGLLRHHVLADVCKHGHGHGFSTGLGNGNAAYGKVSPLPSKIPNLSEVMRNGPFWLDICNPTKEELRALCEIFKMHPLTLEGLESDGEEIREKCDVFEKYYFICIKAFESDAQSDDYMLPINLFMLVSPSCVVTIHRDPLEFSHTIAKRMRLLTARTGLTSDWIVYTILEDVLEMFVPSVRASEIEIDAIDDLVGGSSTASTRSQTHSELLGRIANSRRRVTQLIRLMSAKSDLFRVIAKRCSMRFSEDAHLYLRDLQDHTAMVDQTLHQYDESLNRSHANYLALLSIEISETSNHMSDVMKKLTAASTVALPWSMITGLMGMNIFVPGGNSYQTESWIPWFIFFLAMSASSVIIYFVGRRRDWF
ncbi:Mg2+, CorA-like/Zinc transporter domain-containing protein [Paramicrosporidium saccamoebae]|uniref:Mg2+, CorA-like/Zinc transporter domain-containing protein n=1 Tax=Paramicrosporidium saccamoebae TaxID=1246581 RepID=A0A2H9TGG5_9FUNG|nr:Mg2+, CorA-like/Zinc transporter domain-containing protein [Paramicrosporidium saccamoebae]